MADNPKEDDVKCVCRFCYAFAVFLFVTIDVILDRLQDKNQEYEIKEVVKNISETCSKKSCYFFKHCKTFLKVMNKIFLTLISRILLYVFTLYFEWPT